MKPNIFKISSACKCLYDLHNKEMFIRPTGACSPLSSHLEKKRKRFNSVFYQQKKMTTQKLHQNFYYTTIANQLRTVSWSNNIHSIDVVKPGYGIRTFTLTNYLSKRHPFKDFSLIILIKKTRQPKRRGHKNLYTNI